MLEVRLVFVWLDIITFSKHILAHFKLVRKVKTKTQNTLLLCEIIKTVAENVVFMLLTIRSWLMTTFQLKFKPKLNAPYVDLCYYRFTMFTFSYLLPLFSLKEMSLFHEMTHKNNNCVIYPHSWHFMIYHISLIYSAPPPLSELKLKFRWKGRKRLWMAETGKSTLASVTIKTDGGPDTQSDIERNIRTSKKFSLWYSVSACFCLFQQLGSHNLQASVLQHDSSVVLFLSVGTTMQLGSNMLSEWHGDVSEATERQGQPQHLGLSCLTKGSCNCFSRPTDCTVAVNVTGYNGRSFSDTEQRGQRSGRASEGGSFWFNRGSEVSSFTGDVWSQLGFPVAFAPLCQLFNLVRTKRLLQQQPGKTLLHTVQCLYKGSSSAYCLAPVKHSYDFS